MLLAAFRPALLLAFCLTLGVGLLYPAVVTGVAQLLFAEKTDGSLVTVDGRTVGSALLGQSFTNPGYFWGRPSATPEQPYNALASGASNLGVANPALMERIKLRLAELKKYDPDNALPVPVDLVTASASGLDPHISPAAAEYQVRRVAKARKMGENDVRALVAQFVEDRQFGFLGEPRVNVLRLNLAIDRAGPLSSRERSPPRLGKKR